ncbi:TIGR04540 family protein [Alkaliphilus transvaalensis]|uniref:TIGR04540 family protein n=1 Tax=Alkaliphilus transvaalensis TaxID=114628 RepID=UPI00047D91BB|nr:TIGR04540 family protein [Alkaliphilus transvaalensis]
MEFDKYPKTGQVMIGELIKICDAFWKKEINEEEFKKILKYYFVNEEKKFYKEGKIRSTICKDLGKKRMELISKIMGELS